ncbi:hypothetical protein SDC9_99167 [bioreactor metagenome]|uniref:Uncharacterized protein n=1 Tax=bioreactor metagenome TaxID=1076179 RepID=A0A645AI63_9ZZZZ
MGAHIVLVEPDFIGQLERGRTRHIETADAADITERPAVLKRPEEIIQIGRIDRPALPEIAHLLAEEVGAEVDQMSIQRPGHHLGGQRGVLDQLAVKFHAFGDHVGQRESIVQRGAVARQVAKRVFGRNTLFAARNRRGIEGHFGIVPRLAQRGFIGVIPAQPAAEIVQHRLTVIAQSARNRRIFPSPVVHPLPFLAFAGDEADHFVGIRRNGNITHHPGDILSGHTPPHFARQ